MTCTFGMESCKQYYDTKYVRLPDLLIDLETARADGDYRKIMAKYANPLVLILNEWLLLKPIVLSDQWINRLNCQILHLLSHSIQIISLVT